MVSGVRSVRRLRGTYVCHTPVVYLKINDIGVGRILRFSGTSSASIVSNDNDSAVSYDALQITVRYYILLYSTI